MNISAISARKREQILRAASKAFQSCGFQGASMDRIAEQAQVSKRTVYNHFASKEALFLAVLQDMLEQASGVSSHVYDPEQPLDAQLQAIARDEIALLQSATTQRFARILLGEVVHNAELARIFEQQRPSCNEQMIVWLDAACADGRLCIADTAFAVEQFFGLLKTSAFWPAIIKNKQLDAAEREHLVLATVTMFLRMYGDTAADRASDH